MASNAIHNLKIQIENQRLEAIQALAANHEPPNAAGLARLALLESALEAVREAIEEHGPRLGWGPGEELQ